MMLQVLGKVLVGEENEYITMHVDLPDTSMIGKTVLTIFAIKRN